MHTTSENIFSIVYCCLVPFAVKVDFAMGLCRDLKLRFNRTQEPLKRKVFLLLIINRLFNVFVKNPSLEVFNYTH